MCFFGIKVEEEHILSVIDSDRFELHGAADTGDAYPLHEFSFPSNPLSKVFRGEAA